MITLFILIVYTIGVSLIVFIVKYISASEDRVAIWTRIVEDLLQHLPGILDIRP